jgi:hypothetical protein
MIQGMDCLLLYIKLVVLPRGESRKLKPKVDDVDSHSHSPDSFRLAAQQTYEKHDVRVEEKEGFDILFIQISDIF